MPIAPVVTDTSGNAANSRTRLSDNYDTFLVLLTAQLQNQDPLAPMDSTQFTQQLVQFSQVEQQIRTNEQLEGLVGQYQASSAGAALAYLGNDAIIESAQTTFDGTEANWDYSFDGTPQNVTLEIRNAQGQTVYTTTGQTGPGEHLFTWDGTTTAGSAAPSGVYKLVVNAANAADEAVNSTITVRETILGVDFAGTTPLVITVSGSRTLDSIRAVIDGG